MNPDGRLLGETRGRSFPLLSFSPGRTLGRRGAGSDRTPTLLRLCVSLTRLTGPAGESFRSAVSIIRWKHAVRWLRRKQRSSRLYANALSLAVEIVPSSLGILLFNARYAKIEME